jgi:ribonuclease HI
MPSTPLDRPVSQPLEGPGSDSNPSRAIWIHADESCLGNQFQDRASPGGAAGLVEVWAGNVWERRDYWISEPGTTNNRMALRSAIEGLSGLRYPCQVRFVSDSQYLVKGMSEWIHGWKRRGWKRKGGAIENVELWKELDREAARHKVRWEWVRGHAGHPRNEYANDLAVRAAREQDASNGLVASGFEEWLERQREEKGRYLDEFEFAPPEA